MGIAKTGSGKTLCFVAPLLQKIQHQSYEKSRNIKALILVPTRELAVQIEQTFAGYKLLYVVKYKHKRCMEELRLIHR